MAELTREGNEALYCQVALRESRRSFDRLYLYRVPPDLSQKIRLGSEVIVPFGNGDRETVAYVFGLQGNAPHEHRIKSVLSLSGTRPVLSADQIELAHAMRERYFATLGDAVRCMVPAAVSAVRDKRERTARLVDPQDAAQQLEDGAIDRIGHQRVLELLLQSERAPLQEVMRACKVSRAVLKTLEKKGLLEVFDAPARRVMPGEEDHPQTPPFVPTPLQQEAIDRLKESLNQGGSEEFVLFGVTGSGKTEVYLQVTSHALEQGQSAIVLVPEIALTPQMVSRIRSRFGTKAAVLHSRLLPSQRYEQWQRILRGEARVVVGARSAIFAPLPDLGLIIIDEEQEGTYKSETHPRYHARDIARMRAGAHGAALVLGSATPSIESMHRCQQGKATLLKLPERIGTAGMAEAKIVDMREELRQNNRDIFSRELKEAMLEAFAAGRQAIIFINRRGFSSFLLCRQCGHVVQCPSCSVSMTSHQPEPGASRRSDQLICHYCGRTKTPPQRCPACDSPWIGRFGVGTQQVEKRFLEVFSPYRALRMDQDTTRGSRSHEKILQAFAAREAEVLIGTQMIAKGHDFTNVTVVGILAADQLLGLSDFRAGERAFQLITQAAGRAGRGHMAGNVLIQAYNVDDYALRHAAKQDYFGFYRQEAAYRKALGYPPFGCVYALTLSGVQEGAVAAATRSLHQQLGQRRQAFSQREKIELMPAARAPLFKIKDRYRYRIVCKGQSESMLIEYLKPVLAKFSPAKVSLAIDGDPYQML